MKTQLNLQTMEITTSLAKVCECIQRRLILNTTKVLYQIIQKVQVAHL